MRSFVFAAALLLAGLYTAPALARPFSVDDLLSQEALGEIAIDPTGRYAAVERRRPYAASQRFDLGRRNHDAGARLHLIELDAPAQVRQLMPQPEGYGYLLGPWSPDGRRLVVYRLGATSWELGIADLASASVHWLGLTPASLPGRGVQWRSSEELIVLVGKRAPWELRSISQASTALPERWAASATGLGAHTVVGSGAWRNLARAPELTHVVEVDARRGRAKLVQVGHFADLELSASGQRLALLERGDVLQPSSQRSPQGDWGVATEARRLAMLDFRTGVLSYPCSGRDVLATLLSWAPTSERLLLFARLDGERWAQGELYMVEGGGSPCRRLNTRDFTPELRRRPEALEVGWLADQPLVRGRGTRAPERLDWWRLSQGRPTNLTGSLPEAPMLLAAPGDGLVFLSASRLWRLGAQGRPTILSEGPIDSIAWRPALTSRAEPGSNQPLLVEAGPQLRSLDGPIGLELATGETVVGFSAAAQVLLVTQTTAQGLITLEARRPSGGRHVIMRLNEGFADVDPPRVRPVTHLGPQGQLLTSWLYLPKPGPVRPPLVVRPYLGDNYPIAPSPRPPVLGLVADIRALVGEGYAVLLPSLPLSMSDRAPLHGLAARVLSIVDAAAQQEPSAFDPERLTLWGHSYGGYAVMGVIGQTDRFKAAISMNAPMNLTSIYGAFQPSWRSSPEDGVWPTWPAGWAEDSQGRMGAPPWRAPARYLESSPVFLAETIHTPVMLIHADQDPVPLSQAEEMFSALFRQNKDAVIVTYWGEGHIVSSPGNVRDIYRRAFQWLGHYAAPAAQSCRRPECEESGT